MLQRINRRRVGFGVAAALLVLALLSSPTSQAASRSKAADTDTPTTTPSSCGKILTPSADGHLYAPDGTDLSDTPGVALALANHEKFVTPAEAQQPCDLSKAPLLNFTSTVSNERWAGFVRPVTSPKTVDYSTYVNSISGQQGDYAASWGGLGGWGGSQHIVQAGLFYYIDKTGRHATMDYEIEPDFHGAVPVPNYIGMNFGDLLNIQTTYENHSAIWIFNDVTTGNAISESSPSIWDPGQTAECIQERPLEPDGVSIYPLMNYGTQSFDSCFYQVQGSNINYVVSAGNATQIYTHANGTEYQNTSNPYGPNNYDFYVVWEHR